MKLDACCVWILFKLASTFIVLVLARRSSRFSVQLHHHKKIAHAATWVCLLPRASCSHSRSLRSFRLCDLHSLSRSLYSLEALQGYSVALLHRALRSLLGRFAPLGFVLCTRILGRFALSEPFRVTWSLRSLELCASHSHSQSLCSIGLNVRVLGRSARGPRFKVSSEGLSAEIDIPLRSPIQVQTKADVAYPQRTRWLAVMVCQ